MDACGAAAIAMCDETGILTFSSPRHAQIHQRPAEGLVGRNWRSWATRSQINFLQDTFDQCVSGKPVAHLKMIKRPDGTIAHTHLQMFPSRVGGRTVVIGSFRTIEPDQWSSTYPALSVADYVAEMTAELSLMAARHGMGRLRRDLEQVAATAGDMASQMRLVLPEDG